VPYWGPSNDWGPRDVPVLTPYSGSSRGLEIRSRPQGGIELSRRKTTPDAEETSSLPCHVVSYESADLAHEFWRKIKERESFEDIPINKAAAPASGQERESKSRVARLYKLAAQREQVQNE